MLDSRSPFDENIVCPITGADLFLDGNELTTADGTHRYNISEHIPQLFVDPESTSNAESSKITKKVQDFYVDAPFPNYNEFDDMRGFLRRAQKGVFARILREQIPMGSKLLEVGSGTGQLSNFLSATTTCRVYATDMSLASLKLGIDFAEKNNIKGVGFSEMNLFYPCIKKYSMDIVISIGVLHHTANPRAAFLSIAPLVKPGGHIIVGLYNKIGRLRTVVRRHFYNVFGESILFLDPHLRKNLSTAKRRAWILDQYCHPQESRHTISETLGWFTEAGFEFVSSIPKIIGTFSADEKIFQPQSPGTRFDRYAAEIDMVLSHYGGEGGLYIMIGRKT